MINKLKDNYKLILITAAVFFIIGIFIGKSGNKKEIKHNTKTVKQQEQNIKYWTCSMHPQIKSDKKGLCPICGMELIPVYAEGNLSASGDWELTLSENAIKIMSVETAPVKRQNAYKTLSVFGTISASEEKESVITSWFGGRIDKLYYEVKGDFLRKGSKIADIYSPEIYKAEKELIEAYKSLQTQNQALEKYSKIRFDAAKKKLSLLGLKKSQIKNILKRKEPAKHVSIYAEKQGYILKKLATEGMYVKKGTALYKIATLKTLWVFFDVYESDLIWIKKGQKVEFTSDSFPGKVFEGKIVFINPTVDPKTRTVKIRANIDNSEGYLKPEMFVRGTVYSKVDDRGMVAEGKNSTPLIIPLTAPLITGKRAVVYVEKKKGVFEGREIVLGPKTDKGYVVLEGLKEGEKVVVKGNFLIDSELQIRAKRSMLYGEEHTEPPTQADKKTEKLNVKEEFKKSADFLVDNYLQIQKALSRDNLTKAQQAAKEGLSKLRSIKMKALNHKQHLEWMKIHKTIKQSLNSISKAKSLDIARKSFESLSKSIEDAVKKFGLNSKTVYKYFCPMAFNNKGAYWLQDKEGTENPYFGSKMFKCGSEIEKFTPGEKGEKK